MRAHAGSVGGTGLIAASGFELGQHLAQFGVDLRRWIALVTRTPQHDGRMIAEAENFVTYVGDVGGDIGRIGTIIGIGLEKLVPYEDAVPVAKVVEIFACALADPISYQVEVRELVQCGSACQAAREECASCASSSPQSPPRMKTGTPFTEIVSVSVPGTL